MLTKPRLFRWVVCLAVTSATVAAAQAPRRNRMLRPVIRGRQYAVASMKPQATQVAERILRAGGNAFDAVVAGQAVLGMVDGQNNGVGSDAEILIYDARTAEVISLNAEGTAPGLATIEWYRQHAGNKIPNGDTLLSGTVPGVVDAWYVLLDRWGSMSFEQVLAPAIELAENGFPISERLASAMNNSKHLRQYATSRKVYFPDGKTSWKAGEIFRNPQLARTFRRLVEAEREHAGEGRHAALTAARDRFYRGDIAREMARFSEQNGGLFRYEDFADYHVQIEKPVSIDYRGYRVFKNPSATQAPAELIALNLLETYDLKALGQNSADYIHAGVEAIKLAFADRDTYLGDMDFIQIPFEGLLSKDYARERRKLIDDRHASLKFRPGQPGKYAPGFQTVSRPTDYDLTPAPRGDGDTSYITVVDRDRNVVSFEPSLHTGFGTSVVMADLGFAFNCRGDYFSLVPGHANALQPHKRPRSTLQSTLVLKDGKPVLVTGSPGGDDQCMRTMQTFLNVVEFGMNIQQAIEAPRWSTTSFPLSNFPHTMHPGAMQVEDRIPPAVREDLIRRGHRLKVDGPWSLGSNAGIAIDWDSGVLSAGTDPRCDAYASAW